MTTLSMYRGDDRMLTITASEDLEGSEITFSAKRSTRDDAPVLISKSVGDGIAIGDPTTSAVVTLDAVDTADLAPGTLFWDIEVVDVLGKVHTVATGKLRIRRDVTTQQAGGS